MEKIKELKKEAYKIAMEKYGDGFNYSSDVRIEAMKVYALLTIVENGGESKLNDIYNRIAEKYNV